MQRLGSFQLVELRHEEMVSVCSVYYGHESVSCQKVLDKNITHDMHTLTSERTPGTTASTANVAEANSGNFMLY